jgi:hypothetical protein
MTVTSVIIRALAFVCHSSTSVNCAFLNNHNEDDDDKETNNITTSMAHIEGH